MGPVSRRSASADTWTFRLRGRGSKRSNQLPALNPRDASLGNRSIPRVFLRQLPARIASRTVVRITMELLIGPKPAAPVPAATLLSHHPTTHEASPCPRP